MTTKNLTPWNECNEREINSMVGKAMCAYANAESIKRDAEKNIAEYGHEEYRVAVQACMSEYEATVRCIDMFVKDSLYAIQFHIIDRVREEFGIEAA